LASFIILSSPSPCRDLPLRTVGSPPLTPHIVEVPPIFPPFPVTDSRYLCFRPVNPNDNSGPLPLISGVPLNFAVSPRSLVGRGPESAGFFDGNIPDGYVFFSTFRRVPSAAPFGPLNCPASGFSTLTTIIAVTPPFLSHPGSGQSFAFSLMLFFLAPLTAPNQNRESPRVHMMGPHLLAFFIQGPCLVRSLR